MWVVENHLCSNRRYVSPLCSGHLGLRKQIPQGNECSGHWGSKSVKCQCCPLQPDTADRNWSVGVRWTERIWSLPLLLCFPSNVDWQTSVASPPCLHPTLGLVTLCRSLREKNFRQCANPHRSSFSGPAEGSGGWGAVRPLAFWPHLSFLPAPLTGLKSQQPLSAQADAQDTHQG